MQHSDVIIIGAGQAGLQAASSLRTFGCEGRIVLLGEEIHPPYQRPPLSKAYLKGELAAERLPLKPNDFYAANGIEWIGDARATGLEPAARNVHLSNGSTWSYGDVILATGARARQLPLPGMDLPGVMTLRDLDDADRVRSVLKPGRRIIIIGGGYIGLEVAATAQITGCSVIVLEARERLLARVSDQLVAEWAHQVHEARGVRIRLNARLLGVEIREGALQVRLENEAPMAADTVIVGAGAVPNVRLAEAAGIACDDGILTDEDGRTQTGHVFAIGDCARAWHPFYGRALRLESVANAIDGGKRCAAVIAGKPVPPVQSPWNWSDQYQHKIQTAGVSEGFDQCVARGEAASNSFSVFYFRDQQLIAADCVNTPADFLAARLLITRQAPVTAEQLADASTDLKSLARR